MNKAPQALDHFKRGYQERANLRDRDMTLLKTDKTDWRSLRNAESLDLESIVNTLCQPGCNLVEEMSRLQKLHEQKFATGKPITAIISTLARRRKMGIALGVWQWMDQAGIEKNVFHYNALISVCEKVKDNQRALRLLDEMEERKISKNEVTFSAAISACEKCGQWREAMNLLDRMKQEGVPQTAIAYNGCISACEKACLPIKAIEVFERMKKEGVKPTVITYSALISSAEKGQQWKLALEVLEEMKAAGHGPNVIAYSAAIAALSKGQMWAKALELFRELEAAGQQPSIVTYNSTMTALEKGLQWERALDLFDEMKSKGLPVTVVSYGSALSACEKGKQYRQCLEYLDEMTEVGIQKNVIIFGAAMSCMEKSWRADIGFQLMDRMKMEGVQPNVHIYNSIMSACARCNLWEKGYELFREMEEVGVVRDVVSYNAVLDAVCTQVPLARRLFQEGVERGFYTKVSRVGSQWWELDLHFLSLGGGEVALSWWFEECLVPFLIDPAKLAAVQSICIVTGYGKTRMRGVRQGDDGMRKRVRAMLSFMRIREQEQPNKGRVHIDKRSLEAELRRTGGKIIFDQEGYQRFKHEQTTANVPPDVPQKVRPPCKPLRIGEAPRQRRDRDNGNRGGPRRGPPPRGGQSYDRAPPSRGNYRGGGPDHPPRNRDGPYDGGRPNDRYGGPRDDRRGSHDDRYQGGQSNAWNGGGGHHDNSRSQSTGGYYERQASGGPSYDNNRSQPHGGYGRGGGSSYDSNRYDRSSSGPRDANRDRSGGPNRQGGDHFSQQQPWQGDRYPQQQQQHQQHSSRPDQHNGDYGRRDSGYSQPSRQPAYEASRDRRSEQRYGQQPHGREEGESGESRFDPGASQWQQHYQNNRYPQEGDSRYPPESNNRYSQEQQGEKRRFDDSQWQQQNPPSRGYDLEPNAKRVAR